MSGGDGAPTAEFVVWREGKPSERWSGRFLVAEPRRGGRRGSVPPSGVAERGAERRLRRAPCPGSRRSPVGAAGRRGAALGRSGRRSGRPCGRRLFFPSGRGGCSVWEPALAAAICSVFAFLSDTQGKARCCAAVVILLLLLEPLSEGARSGPAVPLTRSRSAALGSCYRTSRPARSHQ